MFRVRFLPPFPAWPLVMFLPPSPALSQALNPALSGVVSPVLIQAPSRLLGISVSPVWNQACNPTFGQVCSPSDNLALSQADNRVPIQARFRVMFLSSFPASPRVMFRVRFLRPSPAWPLVKFLSPCFQRSAQPTFNRVVSPVLIQAPSLLLGHPGSLVGNQARNSGFDQAHRPVENLALSQANNPVPSQLWSQMMFLPQQTTDKNTNSNKAAAA